MSLKSKILLVLLLLSALWTLFYRLGEPNMYHLRNESRRAQISREMIETGNWLIPQLEEETILTKPPLFYWSVALCSFCDDVSQLTARIPSAVAGFGTVAFTFLIGLLLFNLRVAFFSGFALLATNFFMHQCRYAELEGMLSFFVTASLFFFLKGWKDSARRGRWFALFFTMMGLGMMTKGPFAMTFPLIPIIGLLLYTREMRLLKSRAFLRGIIFFFIIVLPWPLFIMKDNPAFLGLVLWETVFRAATGFIHREPFQFYFIELPRVLLPWIAVLPFSVWLACSKRLRPVRSELLFVLFWFVGNLLFLSLLKSKRDYYLFPITPAVALLVAATWVPLWQWLREKAAQRKLAVLRGIYISGALLAGCSFLMGNPFAVNIPEMHSLNFSPLFFLCGMGMLMTVFLAEIVKKVSACTICFTVITAFMLGVHFLYFTYTVPIRNLEDSGKLFYQAVARIVPQETPLAFAWSNENYTFTFYAHRSLSTIKNEKAIAEFMSSPEKVYLVMRKSRYLKRGPLPWRVVYETPYAEHERWKGYILLCNK